VSDQADRTASRGSGILYVEIPWSQTVGTHRARSGEAKAGEGGADLAVLFGEERRAVPTRRYLAYLEGIAVATAQLKYGRTGRPERLYRLR
jgi:hypothetical protein